MRIVLFDRKKRAEKASQTSAAKNISAEDLKRFHRPKVLKLFAFGNLAAAIVYSMLGMAGILAIMFMDTAIGQRVAFSDMIDLLERSLMHSVAAGAALIVDHIGHQISDIMRVQAAARLIEHDSKKRPDKNHVPPDDGTDSADEKTPSKSMLQKFNEWLGVDASMRDW